jgi:hypothetical protein
VNQIYQQSKREKIPEHYQLAPSLVRAGGILEDLEARGLILSIPYFWRRRCTFQPNQLELEYLTVEYLPEQTQDYWRDRYPLESVGSPQPQVVYTPQSRT